MSIVALGLLMTQFTFNNLPDNNYFLAFVSNLASPIWFNCTVVALMAVIMSTADSYLNTAGILISRSITVFPSLKQKELLIAKLSCALLGFITIPIALKKFFIWKIVFFSYNFWYPIIIIPLIFGFIGTKLSKYSFYLSVTGAVLFTAIGGILKGEVGNTSLSCGLISSFIFFSFAQRYNKFIVKQVRKFDVHKTINNFGIRENKTILFIVLFCFCSGAVYLVINKVLYLYLLMSGTAALLALFLRESRLKIREKIINTFYVVNFLYISTVLMIIFITEDSSIKYVLPLTYISFIASILPPVSLFFISFIHSVIVLIDLSLIIGKTHEEIIAKLISLFFIIGLAIFKQIQNKNNSVVNSINIRTGLRNKERLEDHDIRNDKVQKASIPEFLRRQISVEEKFFRIVSEYEQILETNEILKLQNIHNREEKLNSHIFTNELVSDIKDFTSVIRIQKGNLIKVTIKNQIINLDIPVAVMYQLIFSFVTGIVELAKENSSISLLLKQHNNSLSIEVKYKGYYNTEDKIIKNMGNKKYINRHLLNLTALKENAKVFGFNCDFGQVKNLCTAKLTRIE